MPSRITVKTSATLWTMDATRPTYTLQQLILSIHSDIQFNLFNITFKPIKFNNFMQKECIQ